ncbi:ATP-binding cassette domain-containing protein [Marinobacter similis]|uniref:ATP-binding cassette domain-containing protein n=1 Tax=Marinobacter similis TaxID=1420916 RepID=UPI001EFFCD1F|nr:ATP-binding cassette domain-containing protein [Marinobacter similis]
MLTITDLSLQRGGAWLLQAVNLTVQPGQRVAIVGANGAGKSSLFQLLLGQLAPEQGSVSLPGGCRIAHMAQEVKASDRSARDFVLDGDLDLRRMEPSWPMPKRVAMTMPRLAFMVSWIFMNLVGVAPCRDPAARTWLFRLRHRRPVSAFSGGWRIRLNLAQA